MPVAGFVIAESRRALVIVSSSWGFVVVFRWHTAAMSSERKEQAIIRAINRRHIEAVEAVGKLTDEELRADSLLPGWDRLTIVCHLRYGAQATLWMTEDVLAGRNTSFYPEGRERQRPRTLEPQSDESAHQVVSSLADACDDLDRRFRELSTREWSRCIEASDGAGSLAGLTLSDLALLRLTEVEVHGTDLDLDLSEWSTTFVTAALPFRLGWLTTHRSNHKPAKTSITGAWVIVAREGQTFTVSAKGDQVEFFPSEVLGNPSCKIEANSIDLVAFILGRKPLDELDVSGDRELAGQFLSAFPPP